MKQTVAIGAAVAILIFVGVGIVYLGNMSGVGRETTAPPLAPEEELPNTDAPAPFIPTPALPPSGSGGDSARVPREHTVVYGEAGFNPDRLFIKEGDTVQFRNSTQNRVWVASEPHPAHTGLFGFDALRAYDPDEVYSYTFSKAGIWAYHDHLNPSRKGTIVAQ